MKLSEFFINKTTLAMAMVFTASAQAVGTGEIVSGSGSINNNQNNTVVKQNTDKMVINWDNMDVSKQQSLQFIQPNENSAVLNRVNSIGQTLIQGTLSANGQVFIVNPNGVLISNGAVINVGSLVASSLNIKDSDFMGGNLHFSGKGEGNVINEGNITASNAAVLLGAGEVSNKGTIVVKGGDATLAAGEDITLSFPSMGKINVKVSKGSLNALINNGGLIITSEGSIALTAWATDALTRSVINNTGTLEATQMVMRADGIYLESMGNGNVDIAGNISGTHVRVGGDSINIEDNAKLKSKSTTYLIASKTDGHVKFGKSSLSGNVEITADNVLTKGAGYEPTFTNAQRVTVVSNAKELTVGSIDNQQPIKPGNGNISAGLVNAVTSSKARLTVTSTADNLNLGNDTLDHGDLAVVNISGNVNVNSALKGTSLNIYADQKFEQAHAADIIIAENFTVTSGGNISLNGDVTSGSLVNLQGASINSNGSIRTEDLTLNADAFIQKAGSSLEVKNTYLFKGDFYLTEGQNNPGLIYANANSLYLKTDSDVVIENNSSLYGNLSIDSAADVNMGPLLVNGTVNINANNIDTLSLFGNNSIHGGSHVTLNAKGNIKSGGIYAQGGAILIAGGDISLKNISSGGITNVSAGNDVLLGGNLNSSGDLFITAININSASNSWYPFAINGQRNIVLNAMNSVDVGDVYAAVQGYFPSVKANVDVNGKDITTGNISANGNVSMVAENNINTKNVYGGDVIFQADNDISVASLTSTGLVKLTSGGNVSSLNSVSGSDVKINADGNVVAYNVKSGDDLNIIAGGDVNLNVSASAENNISISANDIWMNEYVSIVGGKDITLMAHNDIEIGNVFAGKNHWPVTEGNIYLTGKNITTKSIYASGDVTAVADGSLTMQNIGANNIYLLAENNINVGSVLGPDSVKANTTSGSITFNTLNKTAYKQLNAPKGVYIGYESDY